MASPAEIECGFGTAKPGDVIPLPAPLGDGWEILAKLTDAKAVKGSITHRYELFLFGVWVGTARATLNTTTDTVVWEEL